MIYCVSFDEVDSHLRSNGYDVLGTLESSTVYANNAGEIVVIRKPNVNGHIPETLVNDAFEAAGILVPAFGVFWCD